jgi:pimeloyl-ACP methyl ester carboxylesterase
VEAPSGAGAGVDVGTTTGPIHVRVWPAAGASAGDAVLVCLHGLTDSGGVFEHLWEELGRRWTVVAPDAPGHGRSPWLVAATYDFSGSVVGVAELLDRLPELSGRSGPVVVLGHSVGALTAARLVALRPDVVSHLIAEEPARRPVRLRHEWRRQKVWNARLQALDHRGRIELGSEVSSWDADELDAWARSKTEVDPRIFDVPVAWGPSFADLLARVTTPVTVVVGCPGRGSATRYFSEWRYARGSGTRRRVVHLDAGHNPRRDAPDAFVAIVRSVMKGCRK